MKWHDYYLPIPAIIVIIAFFLWAFYAPGNAISSATVISTREDIAGATFLSSTPTNYISIVNATAWSSKNPIDSTRSQCPLVVGSQIYVNALTNNFHELVRANMTLYQYNGIGYVPWNGCNT